MSPQSPPLAPPLAPAPNAPPAGRTIGHVASTRTDLVRVSQPELVKRAVLERTRSRLLLAAGGFAVLFGAVAARLADATLISPAPPLRLLAMERRNAPPAEHLPGRAAITDRNGELLAVTLPITALYANPREIQDPAAVARALVRVLPQLDLAAVTARLSGERQFAYIQRSLTPREQVAVNALGVPGLHFEQAERRIYPQGRAAAHVLGGVDVDGNGVAGIERSQNQRLLTRRGDDLRLSLDVRVQLALRDAVQQAITDYNGIGGAGIMMDVQTGEVLGMVSLPDFDLAEPARVEGVAPGENHGGENPRFNRATVGLYEPGSTFKLLTASAALEAGTVNIWGGYDASRPIRYGRFTINDYRGQNRWLSLPEILVHSSNLGAAHMAVALGTERHRAFLVRMGMGARTGIELPETAMPLIPSARNWRDINTMTIAFGQGISVTPLHVVTAISAVANGGILHRPTLMAQPAGMPADGTRVISQQTSDVMRRLMRLVVTDGSGKNAEVPGYFLGGKTGTAQKSGPGGRYMQGKRITAFVGVFPMQAPRYALYVMVDEPTPNARSHGFATAGWVAAPAANMVLRRVAPILGLAPEVDRAAEIQASLAMPLRPAQPRGTPARTGTAQRTAPSASPTTRAAEAPRRAAPAPAMLREASIAVR